MFRRPKNETETHFLLKEVAKYILWGWGYNRLGTEVDSMYSFDGTENTRKRRGMKNIVDVAGVKISKSRGKSIYDVRIVESKATLQDFKSGYCSCASHNYIIAPKGIIPLNLIPENIGLIEVEISQLEIQKYSQKISDMKGVELVKKAKKKRDSRFKTEESYQKWCHDILEKIAYRSGSELLFWRNYIEFTK
jgi:hypothetical protein